MIDVDAYVAGVVILFLLAIAAIMWCLWGMDE